ASAAEHPAAVERADVVLRELDGLAGELVGALRLRERLGGVGRLELLGLYEGCAGLRQTRARICAHGASARGDVVLRSGHLRLRLEHELPELLLCTLRGLLLVA